MKTGFRWVFFSHLSNPQSAVSDAVVLLTSVGNNSPSVVKFQKDQVAHKPKICWYMKHFFGSSVGLICIYFWWLVEKKEFEG